MPNLAQVATNRATLEIPVGEGVEPLRVTYHPSGVTPRNLHAMRALAGKDFATLAPDEQASALDAVTSYLASLLIAWNLDDADGHPIPATREGLQDVDYDTQALVLRHIQADQSAGEGSGVATLPPSSTPS